MFKKILVPSDGSVQSHKAAIVAADLAKSQGAEVVGIYVIDPFPFIGVGDASAVGLQAYMAEAQAAAGQSLADIRTMCEEKGVKFAGDTIERTSAYEGILETAKAEKCDLIVMGSHGRRGIQALILGSVAQKVLTHTDLPVMIIKG
ncbi:MAG TPA: universal stress protein [Burkholderiaceae bacterium]|nr:universal stress protein [Burkholderiaceae bacterium]